MISKTSRKQAIHLRRAFFLHDDRMESRHLRFETFQLGVLLKQARQEAGLTQEEVAQRLQTSKTVISRIENHAPDMREDVERFDHTPIVVKNS